eukprot:gnl/MRDRNA2_/MRDRNA2_240804_c0_seq1.p1 gnl/MRDRNA2_/MRDRNA2_240804_c0~~gnl/MRDRNA2_/MRDRNA2_240804_c0_seq1.p1  ORF type:complete len:436 (-),score=47.49 gnl/MRDRNA2_/MRDRNA2_240804_c0_seq1:82-1389(-)
MFPGVPAYRTAKIVKIRDKRLGALNLLGIVAISSYVVFYQILYLGEHLRKERAQGIALLMLKHPHGTAGCTYKQKRNCRTGSGIADLPYCLESSMPHKSVEAKPCIQLDALDLLNLGTTPGSVTMQIVPTCMSIFHQKQICKPDPKNTSLCVIEYQNTGNNIAGDCSAFIAGVEELILVIDHSLTLSSGAKWDVMDMPGFVSICNGSRYAHCTEEKISSTEGSGYKNTMGWRLVANKHDTSISIKTLLELAAVGLDTDVSSNVEDFRDGRGRSLRSRGGTIRIHIEYRNRKPWSFFPGQPEYSIRPEILRDLSRHQYFRSHDAQESLEHVNYIRSSEVQESPERTIHSTLGIWITTDIYGVTAEFSATKLLIIVMAALGLLKFSQLLVDCIALHCLRDGHTFEELKYQVSNHLCGPLNEQHGVEMSTNDRKQVSD